MGKKLLYFIDNFEGYVCRTLLAVFVTLLFAQIISRQVFGHSLAWTEELSVYMFVWFVYFGAAYAARLNAHNRVTFQYKFMPAWLPRKLEFITDMIWVAFNCYFIYLSYDFVFNKMNLFWKSQTLGVPMKYIYMILPIGFTLITIRVLQVNYYKFIKGEGIPDLDSQEMDELVNQSANSEDTTDAAGSRK
ncbi:TRAP transporter small permease [Granulosicoccus antarcticus]|uniref:TRAP transporter small permease protein n=1 Tax=Granulosicoccus antarcticus IMCC3135 TaxID=1192854 RepID=A0A2Z2NV03_9GAMM|nr:TRAP transporter small permease [Granulosicoccus antarcticus]ASJ73851.1 C4-dicarboxylate TRAP transporter small permease protein DctQ [Granulosicoccus antarcticus IMCC3135]